MGQENLSCVHIKHKGVNTLNEMAIFYTKGYCVRPVHDKWMVLKDDIVLDTFLVFEEALQFIEDEHEHI